MATDTAGPLPPSMEGFKYVLMYTDIHTRKRTAFGMRTKSDAPQTLRAFFQYEGTPKCIRSDNAPDLVQGEFEALLVNNKIKHQTTCEYTPQQNGIAEKGFDVIWNDVRSMLADSLLESPFWWVAFDTACYVRNRLITSALQKSPFEKETGNAPDLSEIRVFGCIAYPFKNKGERDGSGKLADRARKGIFVGYPRESKGWRVYVPDDNRIVKSHTVCFDEATPGGVLMRRHNMVADSEEEWLPARHTSAETTDSTRQCGTEQMDTDTTEIGSSLVPAPLRNRQHHPEAVPTPTQPTARVPTKTTATSSNATSTTAQTTTSRTTRSGRQSRPPTDWFIASDTSSSAALHAGHDGDGSSSTSGIQSALPDPQTVREAQQQPDWDHWQAAIERECKSLSDMGTYEIVPRPDGKPLVDSKWVFVKKFDQHGHLIKYKARLVARGFTQRPGQDYDETYAPVAARAILRLFSAIAASTGMQQGHIDVSSAYLWSDIAEEIYLRPPAAFTGIKPGHVLRLRKSLYGLKQAGHNWHRTLVTFLKTLGFRECATDQCVLVRQQRCSYIAIALHVDDIQTLYNDTSDYQQICDALDTRFKLGECDEIALYCGVSIKRGDDRVELSQDHYVQRMLSEFNMSDSKPQRTPAIEKRLSRDECPEDGTPEQQEMRKRPYAKLVGMAVWLSTNTRPDLAYAVHQLGKFQKNPGEAHWLAAKRLLRYLRTSCPPITYSNTGSLLPYGYCDAAFKGDMDTGKSTVGYIVCMAGGPVDWSTEQRKTLPEQSSCQAEYVSACQAAKCLVYYRQLLAELGFGPTEPSPLATDSQAAAAVIKSWKTNKNTRHYEYQYHYVRQANQDGMIKMVWIGTGDMTADIFTKPLGATKFEVHRKGVFEPQMPQAAV